MSSSPSLSELLKKIAQLNLEREERKLQLNQLDVEISELQANVSACGAELLDLNTSARIYYATKEVFLDMLKSKIEKLRIVSNDGENLEDGEDLLRFIIDLEEILTSEVRRTTPDFDIVRDIIDPKFYHADIEKLIVEILDLFDKWIA